MYRLFIWPLAFAGAYIFLQVCHGFHFLYVEQEHLFLYDWGYVKDTLLQFGGVSKLVSEFLVQFWCIPHIGPLTVAGLAVLTGFFTYRFLKRVFPGTDPVIISLIPTAVLVFLSYKGSFKPSVLVLTCLAAGFLWAISSVKSFNGFKLGWSRIPRFLSYAAQLVVLILSGFFAYKASSGQSDLYKELDWYMYKGNTAKIIDRCPKDGKGNYVYQNFLNWALAERGELADRLFEFPQNDPYSLLLEWREIAYTSVLLSNVYYSMGHVAMSQRMAFEANVIYDNSNPRMLQRLVQTNLLFGAYDVAEKYISRLEKTLFYRRWAESFRRFLRNEELIGKDSELGVKFKGIPSVNDLSLGTGDVTDDLKAICLSNPENETARQYYGAWLLLSKNLGSFASFLDGYRDGRALPKSFREAVMILSESDPGLVTSCNIDQATVQRYVDFKDFFTRNRQGKDLKQQLQRRFGDTYWFYFMYKQ